MNVFSKTVKVVKKHCGNITKQIGSTNNGFVHQWSIKNCCLCFQIFLFIWLLLFTVFYFNIIENPKNIFEEYNLGISRFRQPNIVNDFDHSISSDIQFIFKNKQETINLQKYRINFNPFITKVDCSGILNGDSDSIQHANLSNLERLSKSNKGHLKMKEYVNVLPTMTKECNNFRLTRKYINFPLTAEEQAYPIAYIITIHNYFEMFERLLRAIYHPQNLYCVHVDKKSPQEFLDSVKQLSGCFENVFVASNLTDVHYTHWSRVEADLNCFHDLVEKSTEVKWKYVLNLCGQDFPLKTNLEIVRTLKVLRGYNNMESIEVPTQKRERYKFRYELPSNKRAYALMERTKTKKDPSPLDTPMFAGSAYYIWKREAVEFMLKDPTVKKFFSWNKDSYSPDEHLWATLQRWHPHMPGSVPPHPKYDSNELQAIVRVVKWAGLDTIVYPECGGKFLRGVCVYGVKDLSWLLKQQQLFANKFDSDYDPYAIECLDLWLRDKAIQQTLVYHSKGFV